MARYADRETTEYRMRVWKEKAGQGVRVEVIADYLRMRRSALDQLVYRQRRDGNPNAIYHADACFKNPDPSPAQLRRRMAARRRDRSKAARRSAAPSDTLELPA